jgi:hypothetical protein
METTEELDAIEVWFEQGDNTDFRIRTWIKDPTRGIESCIGSYEEMTQDNIASIIKMAYKYGRQPESTYKKSLKTIIIEKIMKVCSR